MKYFLAHICLCLLTFAVPFEKLHAQNGEFSQKYIPPRIGESGEDRFLLGTDGRTILSGSLNKEIAFNIERYEKGRVDLHHKEQDLNAKLLAEDGNKWKVYPVPVQDKLNISFNLPLESETILEILDLSGKSLFKQRVPQKTPEVSLDFPYPKGFYILRINSSRHYEVFKIIK